LLYSADGYSFEIYEIINNEWKVYGDFSGYKLSTQAQLELRGKFFNFLIFIAPTIGTWIEVMRISPLGLDKNRK